MPAFGDGFFSRLDKLAWDHTVCLTVVWAARLVFVEASVRVRPEVVST